MAEDPTRPSVADLFGEDEDDEDFEPPFKRQALQQDEADEYREAEPADEAADLEEPQEEQQHAEPELEEGEEAGDRVETAEDRAFIDDTEVAAEERYGSDGDDALVHHEEAEEVVEDELDAIFAKGKKKKAVRSQEEMRRTVDHFVARLETAAELDMEAHSNHKPAIHKLKMLPDVEEMVGHRALHAFFMEAGGLGALRTWLEPFERDRSLPNAKIRSVVLRLLKQLPIDMSDPRTKQHVKDSQIGKNVMFLFKLPDETAPNRKLAKELVETWSRPIFFDPDRRPDTSLREQQIEEARRLRRAAELAQQAATTNAGEEGDEFGGSQRRALRPGDPGFRWHASIPQAARMDYTRRPQGTVTLDTSTRRKARNDKVSKHLQKLARKGKAGTSTSQVSIQGRGLAV